MGVERLAQELLPALHRDLYWRPPFYAGLLPPLGCCCFPRDPGVLGRWTPTDGAGHHGGLVEPSKRGLAFSLYGIVAVLARPLVQRLAAG